MNKKLVSTIAIASAVVLSAMPVCAASSSSTNNTSSSNIVSSSSNNEEPAVAEEVPAAIVVSSNGVSASQLRDNKPVSTSDGARVTADKGELTTKSMTAVVSSVGEKSINSKDAKVAASAKMASALTDYVNASGETATKKFGPYKFELLKAGVPQWDNFGTFKTSIGVGNKYEGKTVTVYELLKDGTVTKISSVVKNGKVNLSLSQMGTILVAIQ